MKTARKKPSLVSEEKKIAFLTKHAKLASECFEVRVETFFPGSVDQYYVRRPIVRNRQKWQDLVEIFRKEFKYSDKTYWIDLGGTLRSTWFSMKESERLS